MSRHPKAPSLIEQSKHNSGQIGTYSLSHQHALTTSVFMVPPSLAFAGVLLNNQTLVNIAHEQCQLYRQAMRNESAGLWAHILLGTGIEDRNRWLTGNAWAAYGMMRVLATIQRSPWAGEMGSQISDLQNWVGEIMSTSQNHLVSWSQWLYKECADSRPVTTY